MDANLKDQMQNQLDQLVEITAQKMFEEYKTLAASGASDEAFMKSLTGNLKGLQMISILSAVMASMSGKPTSPNPFEPAPRHSPLS